MTAILLVWIADGWSRQPLERLSTAKTLVLDVETATPDRGRAYWISPRWSNSGLVSDKNGVSQVAMLEDGVELTSHALHADIRERAGLFSHWGDAVLFSTGDGSDPRTNGRSYEVRIPPTSPDWPRKTQIGLLAVAVLLMLHWIFGVAGGSLVKTALWALGGAIGLAMLVLVSAQFSSPARELHAIREAVDRTAAARSPTAGPTRKIDDMPPSRTRHLLRSEDLATFTTEAPLPTARQPRTLTLRPAEATELDDGLVELADASQLRSIEPLDVPASDLESVALELMVTRGSSLVLHLSSIPDLYHPQNAVAISFPVSASSEPQTVLFRRPAIGGILRVRQMAIGANQGTDEPPIVRVKSLQYRLRLDHFVGHASGFDPVDLEGSLRPTLWQSVPGRFSVALGEDTESSQLKLAVGALDESSKESIGFSITAVHRDGQRLLLQRDSVAPNEKWHELALPLPEGSRELILEGERLAPRSALLWSGARLIDRSRAPRRMIMILADTLRADALGSYGREANPTPNLDALARQGARFERAFSQSYWTRPSMASLMTGRYVAATGVQSIDQRLPDAYQTLAEELASGGFTTIGILTNSNAGPHAGLAQGFDQIRLKLSLTIQQSHQTDRLIADIVLPTLDELEDDDLFLYLHLMEAHGPYGPAEPPDDFQVPATGPEIAFDSRYDRPWHSPPTAAGRVALYDYDVRSMDRALGEFFRHLDRGFAASGNTPPIIAFVSDHGEVLGERNQWGHGFTHLYSENVQVPMIIRAPDDIVPGMVFPDPVEIRHLAGTLLDLADIAPRPADSGSEEIWRSLVPLLNSDVDSKSLPFAISAAEGETVAAFSLFGRRYGYVAKIYRDTHHINAFSDFAHNRRLTGLWPRLMLEQSLLRVHHSYLVSQGKIRTPLWQNTEESAQVLDPQTLEGLRALGYLQD